jgi:hypothetical protein
MAQGKIKLGGQQGQSWHVAGPNQPVKVTDYYSYKRAIQVTVSGNSCSAKIGAVGRCCPTRP